MRKWVLLLCLACLGCGSKSPYDYVEASGRLTYDDGTPIPASGMQLLFSAQDAPKVEGAHPRPATADANEQGEFSSVTSYKFGDGVIPGRHKVAIRQVKGPNGRPLIPDDCTTIATTPLMVDTEQIPFEIKVPKPKVGR